ncbi:bridge-like lipid transfer protein family member 3B [Tubulanus polymorphus]|uniref:bridge-like lipid transfer protein family member 3B n=1 Tax=Tubulanus polymorphus TaxID=672921 RepID=UPI003DA28512
MAGLIKNQILKHLSKFTKNLSPDKIKLSTLKGEGDLTNLELDEEMLMDLLDLPTWLRLTKAYCNRVQAKVQWTKLKSQPIYLYLDEVIVEVETCNEPRQSTSNSNTPSLEPSGTKYGFVDRVVDGISLSINSVIINFISNSFKASIQLSRLNLKSKSPTFLDVDLRRTRIRDPDRGEILLFKELEWMTTRIEASGLETCQSLCTTPLRLIANQSKIRISLKKRLSDSSVISSRVQLLLDDLLWVLTDSQLKAAIVFAQSLNDVIEKSSAQSKMAASGRVQVASSPTSAQPIPQQQRPTNQNQSAVSNLFKRFDIVETSYHLYTGRIDLHLCGDMNVESDNDRCALALKAGLGEDYSKLLDCGAMQVTFTKLAIDHYPYHPAGSDRRHWMGFNEYMMSRNDWAQKLLGEFREEVMRARIKAQEVSPQSSPLHGPKKPGSQKPRPRLLECCYVLRLEDFTIYRVSTPDRTRNRPKKFLSSDKKKLHLPPDMSAVHIEHTEYYFPENVDYPVPHANIFAQLNPIQLTLDYLTIIWLDAFILKLASSVKAELNPDCIEPPPAEHKDIKFEALMPRVVLLEEEKRPEQPDRPGGLQIQVSRLTMTNCRLDENSSKANLQQCLQQFKNGQLFVTGDYPNKQTDLVSLAPELLKYAVTDERIEERSDFNEILRQGNSDGLETYFNLTTNSLKSDAASDVWFIACEQFWAEFIDVPKSKNRPIPFIESFPIELWVSFPQASRLAEEVHRRRSRTGSRSSLRRLKQYYSLDSNGSSIDSDENSSSSVNAPSQMALCNVLIKLPRRVIIQIDHYQFIFLMRLSETLSKYQSEIEKINEAMFPRDPNAVVKPRKICVAMTIEEIEIAMICLPIINRNNTSDESEPPLKHRTESADSPVSPSPTSTDTTGTPEPSDNTPETPSIISKSYSDSELVPGEHATPPQILVEGCDLAQQYSCTSSSSGLPSRSQTDESINSTTSVKKGSFFSTMDVHVAFSKGIGRLGNLADKMKSNLDISDDSSVISEDWDSSSLKSGMSSDDEDFVVLGLSEYDKVAPAFSPKPRASSETESSFDESDRISEKTLNTEQNHSNNDSQKMLVVTYRIHHTELIAQIINEDMSLKLQLQHIQPCVHGDLNPDEFITQFMMNSREKGCTPPRLDYFPVKLRFDSGPSVVGEAPPSGDDEKGCMDVRIDDYALKLPMSALIGMLELMEDEVLPSIFPMNININNVQLSLQEDRPLAYTTTPDPIPIDLFIQQAVIRRTDDGLFTIEAASDVSTNQNDRLTRSASLSSNNTEVLPPITCDGTASAVAPPVNEELKRELERVRSENVEMRTRLELLERYHSLVDSCVADGLTSDIILERCQNYDKISVENASLREQLESLRDDKQSLMSALHLLQDELIQSKHK